jgi:hypothetical protein
MGILENFNTTFFISLAITLLAVSSIYIYINYHISQQDHKISSMLGVISTMAQEIDFFRKKLQSGPVLNHLDQNMNYALHGANLNTLIPVSDNEDSDNDESDDDEEDSESDEESDDESYESDEDKNVKKLNINLGEINNDNEIINITEEILNHSKQNNIEDLDDLESEEDGDDDDDDDDSVNTKYIKLSTNNNDNDNDNEKKNDTLDFKKLNINIDEDVSYKNMPVNKLRTIISEKGLSKEPNKLKKNEILKLLGSE